MEKVNFTGQMLRLANMFQPGKFEGPPGKALAQEYFDAVGGGANDRDVARAVDWLRDNYIGYFPQPAAVKRAVSDMAVKRIEYEKGRERMRQLEGPLPDQAKVRQIIDDYFKQSAEKSGLMGEQEIPNDKAQRCDECAAGKRADHLTVYCKQSVSEGGTMLNSGGTDCINYEPLGINGKNET